MFTTILNLAGPLAIRLVGRWLDKRSANADLKAKFQEFVVAMQSHGLLRAEIRHDVNRQRDELRNPPK